MLLLAEEVGGFRVRNIMFINKFLNIRAIRPHNRPTARPRNGAVFTRSLDGQAAGYRFGGTGDGPSGESACLHRPEQGSDCGSRVVDGTQPCQQIAQERPL